MRKRGNNKRQPRTVGPKEACISIMPDGSASYFKPTKKEPRKGVKLIDGEWMKYEKERALY